MRARIIATLGVAALLAGCGGPGSETSRTAPEVAPAPRPAPISGASGLGEPLRSDAQILGVLAAFEQNEIDLARQAIARGVGGRSEDFARGMLRDHERALAETQQRGAEESEQSRAFRARGQATTASTGMEDDANSYRNAFLKAAVADYADVLKTMDAQWLPAAQSEETRTYLTATRRRLADAFERAQAAVSTR
ncbi:DUF4142 domain-containing protein [Stenotrophomonas sp. HITSZ_GD]|uniref:DUF4142 domain-containing protein n=1 Tax=Stenotrophomonas sp. HITSZ_GD TaxID=3037248 RepID=UPI00240DBC39|nr:DUF4142 domain-containing protein [Stenotrophomonas sp. HITSZ_GD]MDG2524985.1 DUF4142 domain-containing protein [Stenotrophomonas sp. HITSZ_GD]